MIFLRNNRGFTLLEVVIALVLMTTVGLSVLAVFSAGTNISGRGTARETAVALARELLEKAEALPFDEKFISTTRPDTVSVPNGFTAPQSLGREYGETLPDDLDDYNGYSEAKVPGFEGFSRAATVTYVSRTDMNGSAITTRSIYKRMTVTVTSKKTISRVILSTVFAYAR